MEHMTNAHRHLAADATGQLGTFADGFRVRRPFHITLMRDRQVRRSGVDTHTTINLALIDRCHAGGFDVLSAARTVIDLARSEDARPRWSHPTSSTPSPPAAADASVNPGAGR